MSPLWCFRLTDSRLRRRLFLFSPSSVCFVLQVRRLYRQALRSLPLCAALWKDVNHLLTFSHTPHTRSLQVSPPSALALVAMVTAEFRHSDGGGGDVKET